MNATGMMGRTVHPCRFCNTPCPIDKEVCGKCPARRASQAEIELAWSDAAEEPNLSKCTFCGFYVVRTQGCIDTPDMYLSCLECRMTQKEQCQHPLHDQWRHGVRHVIAGTVETCRVIDQRKTRIGTVLKLRICQRCKAKGHETTWSEWESLRGQPSPVTGAMELQGTSGQLKLMADPWDAVGGVRNRWMPKKGIAGTGDFAVFNPKRWSPVTIQGRQSSLWVAVCDRLMSEDGSTVTGSIVHAAVRRWLNSEQSMHSGTRDGKAIAQLRDVGWCYVEVLGAEDDGQHRLYTACHRKAPQVTLDDDGMKVLPPLSEWVAWCHYQVNALQTGATR